MCMHGYVHDRRFHRCGQSRLSSWAVYARAHAILGMRREERPGACTSTDWPASGPSWMATVREVAPYSCSMIRPTRCVVRKRSLTSASVNSVKRRTSLCGITRTSILAGKDCQVDSVLKGINSLSDSTTRQDGSQIDKGHGEGRTVKYLCGLDHMLTKPLHAGMERMSRSLDQCYLVTLGLCQWPGQVLPPTH